MMQTSNRASVAVVGAGISGLTVALRLKASGVPVQVFEARSDPGGVIQTYGEKGYQCEDGPNTLMVSEPRMVEWLRKINVWSDALDADASAKKRFVVQDGRLLELPLSPWEFVTSPVLSWSTKGRLLGEPWVPKGKNPDETLAAFVRRRLGEEPLRELVGPFVSGVYAGDPERLRVRHAFPKLWNLEQTDGSLIRGAIRKRKERAEPSKQKQMVQAGPNGRMISWAAGMRHLIEVLKNHLDSDLQCSTRVTSIERRSEEYHLHLREEGSSTRERSLRTADRLTAPCGNVILATDAATAAKLLEPIVGRREVLLSLPYAPMAVIHLGFKRTQVEHPLDGFGVLISRARKIRSLGALFSSTLFPNRAPEGHVLLTVFMGGRLDPEVVGFSSEELVQLAVRDFSPLLSIKGEASFERVTKWQRAIPQYEEGYDQVLGACKEIEENNPGLYLLGNYRGGVSLENCMLSACNLAEAMVDNAK